MKSSQNPGSTPSLSDEEKMERLRASLELAKANMEAGRGIEYASEEEFLADIIAGAEELERQEAALAQQKSNPTHPSDHS